MEVPACGPIRVFVADDHAPFRRALTRVLSITPGLELVGEADNGTDARDQCRSLRPDVAILDLVMPGMNGVEVTRDVKQECRTTKVIILTVFNQEQNVRRGLEAGADRYLPKGLSSEELVATIKAVANEGTRSGEGG